MAELQSEEKLIKAELGLYRIREVSIEDMKLEIEQLQFGDQLGSPGFDEKVQTSMSCQDNGAVMDKIENLKNKIRVYEIANRRVDNSLKILNDYEREIITKVFIDHKSISRVSAELFKSRKSVNKAIDKAIPKLKTILGTIKVAKKYPQR